MPFYNYSFEREYITGVMLSIHARIKCSIIMN